MPINTPFITTMHGTAYEREDHTIRVSITTELYEHIKKALAFLNAADGFQSVIITDYPDRVYEGFIDKSDEIDPEIEPDPEAGEPLRVDHSELIVDKDGDMRWEYRIKHVYGCQWEAWGLTVAELDRHFTGA